VTVETDDASSEPQARTMQDVARLAGVSAMTVSRALRSDASISESTRARILEVIERVGYIPDQTANMLASRRSGFVVALIPVLNNSNFADTVRGINDAIAGSGLQMILGATEYSPEREEELIATMLRRRPEGIILAGSKHTPRARRLLRNAGLPIVQIWDFPDDPLDQVVGFSNVEAARAMVLHLAERGYRRIGFIGSSVPNDTRGFDRQRGYAETVEELGLGPPCIINAGKPPGSIEQGGLALGPLLERWPDLDAVFCVSDLAACGALAECQRRGLAVPGDIAIAGFGDFEISRCTHPRISTVAVASYDIGALAGRHLVTALEYGGDAAARPVARIRTPFTVIAREST
jgi:LacI family gluconate utilization system Gnt-I transcriptional repressor